MRGLSLLPPPAPLRRTWSLVPLLLPCLLAAPAGASTTLGDALQVACAQKLDALEAEALATASAEWAALQPKLSSKTEETRKLVLDWQSRWGEGRAQVKACDQSRPVSPREAHLASVWLQTGGVGAPLPSGAGEMGLRLEEPQRLLWCETPGGRACVAASRAMGLQPVDQVPEAWLAPISDLEEDCTTAQTAAELKILSDALGISPESWHDNVGDFLPADGLVRTAAGGGCTNCCWVEGEPKAKVHITDSKGTLRMLVRVWEADGGNAPNLPPVAAGLPRATPTGPTGGSLLWCESPSGAMCRAAASALGLSPQVEVAEAWVTDIQDEENDCASPAMASTLDTLARSLRVDPANWHDNVGKSFQSKGMDNRYLGAGCTNCCWAEGEPSVKVHLLEQGRGMVVRVWETGREGDTIPAIDGELAALLDGGTAASPRARLWCDDPKGSACLTASRALGLEPMTLVSQAWLSPILDGDNDCAAPQLTKDLAVLTEALGIKVGNWHDNSGKDLDPDHLKRTGKGGGCTNCCWQKGEPWVKAHMAGTAANPYILYRVWEGEGRKK